MKRLDWKIVLIVGFTLAGLYAMWPPKDKLKLGIDLAGGTILVYEVDRSNQTREIKMDELISALKKRADPQGVKEIPIRQVGGGRFEIILPKASNEEVEEVKKMLTDVGSLEFRILANRKHDLEAITRALGPGGLAKPPVRYKWARLGEISTGTNPIVKRNTIGDWILTDPAQEWKKDLYAAIEVELTGQDASGREATETVKVRRNMSDTLVLDRSPELKSITSYRIEYNPSGQRGGDPNNPRMNDVCIRQEKVAPGRIETWILCNLDRPGQEVTGKYLKQVRPDTDERLQPAVSFEFDARGATRFRRLTHDHSPEEGGSFQYQLAILLDNMMMSAPSLRHEISDKGIIEGGAQGFKAKEVEHLIQVLRAGSLPASVNPTPLQEETVGPTLGDDTIAKGVFAIWVSLLVVPVFMVFYYRFAGIVAVLALAVNMILLIGSMAFIQATFSLPGLAGLALTIGMAVDANVLVFERMREEKERGASLAQQIRNGFNRAWVTIFDSHVTNFLAALVLYIVGTEEVKGFALTMMIGMAWNLFTAVFMSRVIFEYSYKLGWLKNVKMLKMLGKTDIDFIGPRYYCMAGSFILIVMGIIATGVRGQGMFNIDFTGGTLVTIRLNDDDPSVKTRTESQRAQLVRDLATSVLPDVTVESLRMGEDKRLPRFNIRTTEKDTKRVQKEIVDAFGPKLARVEMKYSEGKPLAAAPASGEAPKTAPAPTTRFPGGRAYDLSINTTAFNSKQTPAQAVSALFAKVLEDAKIINPTARFEIVVAPASRSVTDDEPASRDAGTNLILRTDLEPDAAKTYLTKLQDTLANDRDLLFERITNFGETVAGETRTLAVIATIASWIIIIVYLWWRFHSFTYGLAAVLAVVHDVLITLGAIAVSYWLVKVPYISTFLQIDQFKIDLPIVAAFLTLIGFSVNDTIVIFDRIREIKGKTPNLTNKMVNDAINQTLSRTILTSFTAWLVVVILYFAGGEGLHGFAFALVVGFLSGTYSTVYIATPILIDWVATKPLPAKAGKQLAATTMGFRPATKG
ncbi:MAG: protein translocase subunit SecD [Isosphaerales bacterium]